VTVLSDLAPVLVPLVISRTSPQMIRRGDSYGFLLFSAFVLVVNVRSCFFGLYATSGPPATSNGPASIGLVLVVGWLQFGLSTGDRLRSADPVLEKEPGKAQQGIQKR
jgi:hypothetical protein